MNQWLLIITLLLQLCCSGCHVGRFFVYNFADIRDHKKFPKIEIEHAPKAERFQFVDLPDSNQLQFQLTMKGESLSLDQFMKKTGTVALLVIKNDSIYLEHYRHKDGQEAIVPSFSAAKSFTSALVGLAIADGYIDSVQQSIRTYIPELPEEPFQAITLEHLLEMRSGLKFNESYVNPFGHVAKFYYGTNLKKFTKKLKAKHPPNLFFNYISVNTQLLGWAIENATGKKLPDYLEEKIWHPLGMEYNASWSLDSRAQQTTKAFCCLNARARDFAKFGRLYLNYGNWNGQQIIPRNWVETSTDFTKGQRASYRYQWWRWGAGYKKDFFAQGILGQFIYVNREENLVIVRLGRRHGSMNWPVFFQGIAKRTATPSPSN